MAGKLNYYIIETDWPGYEVLNMYGNPEYKELYDKQIAKTLEKPYPNAPVMPRACLYQREDMLVERYYDENGIERQKFRDDVLLLKADDRGRLFVDGSKPEFARNLLRQCRIIDPSIKLDTSGLVLPEELPEDLRKRNLGGRPRKDAR